MIDVARIDPLTAQPGTVILMPDNPDPWPMLVITPRENAQAPRRAVSSSINGVAVVDFDKIRCRNGVLTLTDKAGDPWLDVDHMSRLASDPEDFVGTIAFTADKQYLIASMDRGGGVVVKISILLSDWSYAKVPDEGYPDAIWLLDWRIVSTKGEVLVSPALLKWREANPPKH